jgi:hypothetical protein
MMEFRSRFIEVFEPSYRITAELFNNSRFFCFTGSPIRSRKRPREVTNDSQDIFWKLHGYMSKGISTYSISPIKNLYPISYMVDDSNQDYTVIHRPISYLPIQLWRIDVVQILQIVYRIKIGLLDKVCFWHFTGSPIDPCARFRKARNDESNVFREFHLYTRK